MRAPRIYPVQTVRRMLERLDARALRLAREGRIGAACAAWSVSDGLYHRQASARLNRRAA